MLLIHLTLRGIRTSNGIAVELFDSLLGKTLKVNVSELEICSWDHFNG